MTGLIYSFKNAINGLVYAVSKERNLQIELVAAIVVVATMVIIQVERWEAVVLSLSIFAVLLAELANTIVERLVNIFKPRVHPYAKIIKDITAGMVLLTSLGAALMGAIIFWPYIF